MKELDFTGEWLTRNGYFAHVIAVTKQHSPRCKFIGNIAEVRGKFEGTTCWDADGRCPGYSGWDLQKRLDGYTE